MKKNIKTVALFAALSMLSVGCQKESIMEPSNSMDSPVTMRVVNYSVDGITHQVTLFGEESWQAFLAHMFELSRNGAVVSFAVGDKPLDNFCAKDVVTYTTTSETDAVKWSNERIEEGYKVTIVFDNKTGIYTCIAVK
jgi:hypothetical protein